MDVNATVMVIDDEPSMCGILEQTLLLEGFRVSAFIKSTEAMSTLDKTKPDIVLTDLLMPEIDGMGVIDRVQEYDKSIPVIVITAHGTIDNAVEAIRKGAYDYVTKPFLIADLLIKIRHGLDFSQLNAERDTVTDLLNRAYTKDEPVGESPAWRDVMAAVDRVAKTPSPVLILGETGSGKEMLAHAIHRRSEFRKGRFVPVNCASIPEPLLESELFGHEKGAFTNAVSRKLGLFELADDGTLFLDEIGDMPILLQAKLLRALEERRIQRVGGVKEIAVNPRVLAATHRDLKEEIAAGRFREDLYYRVHVLTLRAPPLRERVSDIPLLAEYYIQKMQNASGSRRVRLSDEAAQSLQAYSWPGNARELRNVIERAVTMCNGLRIDIADLNLESYASGDRHLGKGDIPLSFSVFDGKSFSEAREVFERDYLVGLLRNTGGNVSAAAKAAVMSRRNLYEKIEKLGIDSSEYKDA